MIDWLYPVRCPGCFLPVLPKGALVHSDCERKFHRLSGALCMKCGCPLESEEQEYCPECEGKDRVWDVGRSVFSYQGSAGKVLRCIKREGTEEFVRYFAIQMKKSQEAFIRRVAPDCIVPVPLHPSRQRSRGFNQAELLAKALGVQLELPVRLLLKKHKKTKDQKSLNRLERSKNVQDAFFIDREALGGNIPQSVLLVDDVVTTGSTLSACALAYLAAFNSSAAFLSANSFSLMYFLFAFSCGNSLCFS